MDFAETYNFLKKHHQTQLIPYLQSSLLKSKKSKKAQKKALEIFPLFQEEDLFIIEKIENNQTKKEVFENPSIEPIQKIIKPIQKVETLDLEQGSQEIFQLGENLLRKGKLGLIILAGGEGSRLGFSHPKGMFPISVVKKKSLFQLCMEKVLAAEKKYQCQIPLAIMLSPLNQKEVVQFFEKHQFFGLKKSQILFFTQKVLPFFDQEGKWVWNQDHIEVSPDGNGSVFSSFYKEIKTMSNEAENGLEKMKENLKRDRSFFSKNTEREKIEKFENLEHFVIFSIDNPLVDPFSLPFLGMHLKNKKEISALCMQRDFVKKEKEGVFVAIDNKIQILEYIHLPKEVKESSEYCFSNPGIYCITKAFFQKAAKVQLPFHKIVKKASSGKEFFKYERFIIDIFPYAEKEKIQLLFCDKNTWFSPLKNKRGKYGVQWVKKNLFQRDKKIFFSFFQKKARQKKLEISSEFFYPTVKLEEKYKEKIPKNSYIAGIGF